MFKMWTTAATLTAGLALAPAAWAADDLKTVVDKSMKAMGVENVHTMVISGQAWNGSVGQGCDPHDDFWRKFLLDGYSRSIDFDMKGWRVQYTRKEGDPRGCGGAGTTNPAPDSAPTNQVTPPLTPTTAWTTQLDYIFLPEGFLKTALERNATVSMETMKGKKYTVLTFMGDPQTAAGQSIKAQPVKGYVDDMGYVDRVETMVNGMDPIGDAVFIAEFDGYKDFGGVKFPAHMDQRQGPAKAPPKLFEMNVADVKVNVPVDLTPPARGGGRGGAGRGAGRGGPAVGANAAPGRGGPGGGRGAGGGRGPAVVADEDLGSGAWLVPGGYAGVVVNFKDYSVVVEAPSNEARALAIIAEAHRLVPNKPIRYVINTHAHFDHAGGLRAFVAEGSTIVTSQGNKGYWEMLLANPHTLQPDKMSTMNPQPKIKVEYVGESKKMTGGENEIDLYHIQNSMHSVGNLIVYLPKQKVLIEADEFNVLGNPAPTAPAEKPNQYQVNLLANIERLHLDVDRIIPIHLPNPETRTVTLQELKLAAGKS